MKQGNGLGKELKIIITLYHNFKYVVITIINLTFP